MKPREFNFLRETADEYTYEGGGAGGDNFDYSGMGDDDLGGDGSGDGAGDNQQQQQQTAPAPIDFEALTQAIVRGVTSTSRQDQQQQQREMTDEEFRKHTNYYQVPAPLIKDLFGDEDETVQGKKAQLLQQMLDGAVNHALKVAGMMTHQNVQTVRKEYEPLLKAEEKRIYNDFVSDLVKTAPVLSKMRPVVDMAISQLTNSGYVSQGAAKDKQEVLKLVTQFAKAANPNFSLGTPTPNGNRAGMPRMANGVNGAGGQQSQGRKGALPRGIALYK